MTNGEDGLASLSGDLLDLWRRRPTFRQPLLSLGDLPSETVARLVQATADGFELEYDAEIGVAAAEWESLLTALSTLYAVSRGRGVDASFATGLVAELAESDLSTDQMSNLRAALIMLLEPDRPAENTRITERTALASALTVTERIGFTVDFRLQERFPDELPQLVPVILAKVVSFDPVDGHHQTFTHQMPSAVAEAVLEGLQEAIAQRDAMLGQLREQGLA